MTIEGSNEIRIPVRTVGHGRASEGSAEQSHADPAALGLLAYGMPTLLYSLSNVKAFELGTAVLGMAVVFGGLAQLAVAVLAARRGQILALTTFAGLGAFWLTYALLLVSSPQGDPPDADTPAAIGWYLALWAVFAVGVAFASTAGPRAVTLVLGLTGVLLAVLAISYWSGAGLVTSLAGWVGIVTGLVAMYAGFALVINESLDRLVLPVGDPPGRPGNR